MRLRWMTRQVLAFLLLSLVLVLVSSALEIGSAVRSAIRQARVEAEIVSGTVRREIGDLARIHGPDSLQAIGADPRMEAVLGDAMIHAPTVLRVGVADPNGIVFAHTEPQRIGQPLSQHPPLPEPVGLGDTFALLRQLKPGHANDGYSSQVVLQARDKEFCRIQVVLSRTYVWKAVQEAFRRGMLSAAILIPIAAGLGLGLAWLAIGRIRALEAGVTAIREGRFAEPIPESGAAEFRRLAHELNMLGAEFQRRRSPIADPGKMLVRLGTMASGVAHELNNHLAAIQSNLEAAKREDPAEVPGLLDRAREGLDSIGGVVRGFLKIARVRPIVPRHLSVNVVIEALAEKMSESATLAGVELVLEMEPDLPETWADPEVLSQDLENLIRNALQAMAETGGRLLMKSSLVDGRIRISVQDNGPGMPQDVLERARDLYFTTKADGSGVGLALVQQAIDMHGGNMEIISEPGKGTQIDIDLTKSRTR